MRLSSQQLPDCTHTDDEVAELLENSGKEAHETGCYEAQVEVGFKFIKEHGIVSESAYPFERKRKPCRLMPVTAGSILK